MRRPKPQPKQTSVPRLRNARLPKQGGRAARDHTSVKLPTPRLTRGRTYRLRSVHRD
jgi:hypothetical protein